MGKKGVLLDNGKTAQNSMTLYWKNNKNRQKNPKEKGAGHINQQQQTDKRVMSNFQKWKLHKEKAITKAYTKPTKNDQQKEKKLQLQQEALDDQFLKRYEHKQKKIVKLPGFRSRQKLSKKLQIQTVQQGNQSTNVLKLPPNMSDMSQQQIIQLLRSKKNRQTFSDKRKHQTAKNTLQQHDQQDVLLGQDFINLMKNTRQAQIQNLKAKAAQKQKPQVQQLFFKSDILNKIDSNGIKQLEIIAQTKQQLSELNDSSSLAKVQNQNSNQKSNPASLNQTSKDITKTAVLQKKTTTQNQPIKDSIFKSKFIPRILQK